MQWLNYLLLEHRSLRYQQKLGGRGALGEETVTRGEQVIPWSLRAVQPSCCTQEENPEGAEAIGSRCVSLSTQSTVNMAHLTLPRIKWKNREQWPP